MFLDVFFKLLFGFLCGFECLASHETPFSGGAIQFGARTVHTVVSRLMREI